jgi:hypothetical protein
MNHSNEVVNEIIRDVTGNRDQGLRDRKRVLSEGYIAKECILYYENEVDYN